MSAPAEVRVAPAIPVRELLGGRAIAEPEGLHIADAPIQIVSFRPDPQTTEYAAVVDTTLMEHTLFNFLKQASPNPRFDSEPGVD